MAEDKRAGSSLLTSTGRPTSFTLEQEPTLYEECCPGLDFTHRMAGFIVCACLGFLVNLMSFTRVYRLLHGNPVPFATAYSLGNILSLAASFFLIGFKNQLKAMTKPTRIVAAAVYAGSIAATLVVVLMPTFDPEALRIVVLCLCCLVQFCALWWYTLSYIPYGRRCVKGCFFSWCSWCK